MARESNVFKKALNKQNNEVKESDSIDSKKILENIAPKEKAGKNKTIYITHELNVKIKNKAHELGVSESQLISDILNQVL